MKIKEKIKPELLSSESESEWKYETDLLKEIETFLKTERNKVVNKKKEIKVWSVVLPHPNQNERMVNTQGRKKETEEVCAKL